MVGWVLVFGVEDVLVVGLAAPRSVRTPAGWGRGCGEARSGVRVSVLLDA